MSKLVNLEEEEKKRKIFSMYGATPKLQAKNLELCSDKKIKLSFYFRPQNLFTCVGERKRERERDVELFNFEK